MTARPDLSKRERDVMKLIALGFTQHQTAVLLYMSDHTARSHLKRIREKYAAVGSTATPVARLVHRAIEDGVIEPITPLEETRP